MGKFKEPTRMSFHAREILVLGGWGNGKHNSLSGSPSTYIENKRELEAKRSAIAAQSMNIRFTETLKNRDQEQLEESSSITIWPAHVPVHTCTRMCMHTQTHMQPLMVV